MDINIKFSETLKLVRKSRGYTQEQLAERSGIDYKYLQKLESKNPSSPTLQVLEKLALGLGISLYDFIKEIEERKWSFNYLIIQFLIY